MKFIAALVALAVAQEEGGEGSATCTKDDECAPDANGAKQRCATMTMEGFSVDQCVADILCGETMEIDGVEMNYNCFDTGNNAKLMAATASAMLAIAYSTLWEMKKHSLIWFLESIYSDDYR